MQDSFCIYVKTFPLSSSGPGENASTHILLYEIAKNCLLSGQEQACSRITWLFVCLVVVLFTMPKWPHTKENGVNCVLVIKAICKTNFPDGPKWTRPNQTRPDDTRTDQTRPDQTQPDPIRPNQTHPDPSRPDQTQILNGCD